MYILFSDEIQNSDAGENIKSPALSETTNINKSIITITFNEYKAINAIGIGNADLKVEVIDGWFANAVYTNIYEGGSADTVFNDTIDGCGTANITISFNDINNTMFNLGYIGSGLYMMNKTVYASTMTLNTTASKIGRIGAGIGVKVPTSIAKEPSFNSTATPRITLAGQVVKGMGGYNYKSISLDSRYKLGQQAMDEIMKGYKYIGMGYPFFIDLSDEAYKLPYSKFYGTENNQQKMSFESGIYKYLYSRRFNFREAF